MKTLDEVIEIASDWTNGFDEKSIEKQMLHYLKEYKTELEKTAALPDYYELVNFWSESMENPPLEWKEIEKMVGQPVWIEGTNGKMWGIIAEVYKDMFGSGKMTLRTKNMHRLHLNEKNIGATWNAYRMERKERYVNEYL